MERCRSRSAGSADIVSLASWICCEMTRSPTPRSAGVQVGRQPSERSHGQAAQRGQFGAAGQAGVEPPGVLGVQVGGVAHDPAGELPDYRCRFWPNVTGPERADGVAGGGVAAAIIALAGFFSQAGGPGAPLTPLLAQVARMSVAIWLSVQADGGVSHAAVTCNIKMISTPGEISYQPSSSLDEVASYS
jgi:hypothetical protein